MTAKTIIIGGGASGLMAAIAAGRIYAGGCKKAQKKGREVLVLERMDKAGKKLLATGNGRCNFSNMHMDDTCYHSQTPWLIKQALGTFGLKETLDFFDELGLFVKNRDGYLYPLSGQASTVLDVLLMELKRLPVEIKTGCEVISVKPVKNGYEIRDGAGTIYRAPTVIVACGGCAYPKLGSNGGGYRLASGLGLKVITPRPALTGLYGAQKYFKKVSGVRADARLSLYIKKGSSTVCAASDRGEVQLTDYGISGIPAFQVSYYASKALARGQMVAAALDFMPDMPENNLFLMLKDRARLYPERSVREFLIGILHQKLCALFTELACLPEDKQACALSSRELFALAKLMKALPADIVKTGGFDNAQVCSGGVDGRELSPQLEAKGYPGLYFAGELIDVDGICGGYNLQWAWSSGYIAGSSAPGVFERKNNGGL